MPDAYHGKLLKIDLTTGHIEDVIPAQGDYRDFLGGSGLAAKIYDDSGFSTLAPLDQEAPLLIVTGTLTGHNVPTACKAAFCGKSPATGIWTEAIVGGYWPAALKACGLDGLIVTGKAPGPVCLVGGEGGFSIEKAGDLWGEDVFSTVDALTARYGAQTRVAAIGPAGERQVLISSVIIDGRDARAAGRCGMGALMGSKNLKAIAVKKSAHKPSLFNTAGLAAARKKILPTIREKARGLTDFGTAGGVPAVEKLGDLPIRNWTGGSWSEGAAATSGQAMAESHFVKHYACYACPIRCGKEMRVPLGPYSGEISHGPEYETVAGFGAMCLNNDPAYIIAANDLCNRLGVDTISGSAVVAFAMELNEHGLLPAQPEGALEIRWGSGKAILDLIRQIAYREGIGEVLGRGVRRAAAEFGPPAAEFAVESKGLEFPYHDPRAFTSMAVVYATGNRGACHLEGLTYFNENRAFPGSMIGLIDDYDFHGTEGKAMLAKTMQDYMVVFNALGLCKFLVRGQVPPEAIAEWVTCATGWNFDRDILMTAGERIFNLKRKINVALGVSRKDDTLPPRLLVHDRETGHAAGSLPHLGRMLHEYYQIRGWTMEGIPRPETLARLGLS